MIEKKHFELNERVEILGVPGLDGATGEILGKSSEHIIDFYIVLLDKPIPKHRAVVLPEGQLFRIHKPL